MKKLRLMKTLRLVKTTNQSLYLHTGDVHIFQVILKCFFSWIFFSLSKVLESADEPYIERKKG